MTKAVSETLIQDRQLLQEMRASQHADFTVMISMAGRILASKLEQGLPVFDPVREEQALQDLAANSDPLSFEEVRLLYGGQMVMMRVRQLRLLTGMVLARTELPGRGEESLSEWLKCFRTLRGVESYPS